MTGRETAGREGKGEDGRARTREVKLAVFFTQDKLDKDGYPVRDRASTSVIATFEPAADVREPGEGRGHPPRRGPRPPAHHPRRRRRLDLGHRHRQVPRGDPDRGPLPRPRAPARPRPEAGVHAAGPQGRMARRPPGGPRLRRHRRHRGRHQEVPPRSASRRTRSTAPSATSRTTPPACATTGSASAACSSAPASSRPAARPSSAKDSSRQACTGPSAEPTPSSPSAAREASSTWEAICNTPRTQTRTA